MVVKTLQWLTALEIASLRLTILPQTKAGVILRGRAEGWVTRKRVGRGGGFEYAFSSLPIAAQEEIKKRQTEQLLKETTAKALPAVENSIAVRDEHSALTVRQRQIESGRIGILNAIERLMQQSSCTKEAAMTTLLTNAASGEHPDLEKLFELARDTRGTGKRATQLPSVRTIKRWFSERDNGGSLAPAIPQLDASIPPWANSFLKCYQQPMKPSVRQAYDWFCTEYEGELPSIHQVRRFLKDRMGNVTLHRGRMGPKALADIDVFKRRSIANLHAGEVYIADGHTFDAEVISPITGQPCRPEITAIKDVATDTIVAAVASFAESALSTLSAIRHCCMNYGPCAIFYVDNGSGYINRMMADESLGLFGRLGITLKNSLPYNAKAKGKIERLHRTLFVPLAKTYPTYIGADMDRQAANRVHKLTRKDLTKGIKPALMPDWDQFCQDLAKAVKSYNNAPNRAQPTFIDALGKRRHMTPTEKWAADAEAGHAPQPMDHIDDSLVFYPQVTRTVRRGEIEFGGKRYFSADLREFNGEQLPISYDPADSRYVWVYDTDHRLISKAERDGNSTDFFSDSEVAKAQARREQAQLQRLEKKKVNILSDGRRAAIEPDSVIDMGGQLINRADLKRLGDEALTSFNTSASDDNPVIPQQQSPQPEKPQQHPWQARMPAEERYQLYLQTIADPDRSAAADAWIERYQQSHEFAVMQDNFNAKENFG